MALSDYVIVPVTPNPPIWVYSRGARTDTVSTTYNFSYVKLAFFRSGAAYICVVTAKTLTQSPLTDFVLYTANETEQYQTANNFISESNYYIAYCYFSSINTAYANPNIPVYNSLQLALDSMNDDIWGDAPTEFSIAYIPISCALSGPTSAQEGDEITVTITPNDGYVFTGAQYVSLTTESDVETPEFTVDGNEISFIMPNGAVQVTVRCVKANPYDEGGDSSINGGGGTFDNPDDVIDGPSLPSLSAIASGFIRMYNPTQGELTDFSAWLQDSSVFTAAFRDMFGKPIESVVSLAIAPFIPPRSDEKDYVVISGTRSVGIQMYQVTRQYTEIDCGEITPKEYWGGFLDYAPFTKTSLYLPYVGYREINVNEIMEKPLKVFYHIDVFTGASVCFVMCGGNVLYHYDCNVLTNIPFGATEYNNFVSGVLNIAAQSATIAAAGTSGVGAAMIPSAATNIAASAANMIRPSFPHSGVVTANSGLLSIKTPYLILERPRQATPKDINHYTGFPSYVTSRLSDLSGYTKISDIHLENVPASDDELSEIETLLRNGVIL